MESTIDIVKIVEKSPLNRFGDNVDYQSSLIDKLRKNFSTDEEHLFLASFYCYLNYDKNAFLIDLEQVWEWIGFSRIDPAVRLLKNQFTEGKDYKILLHCSVEQKGRGGHNAENIFLTVNCFKKLCLKARTNKADQIHDYYIKLEETLYEFLEENNKILADKLKIKDEQIKIALTDKEQTLITNFNQKPIIYIGSVEDKPITGNTNFKRKFGFTNDIKQRLYNHKREIGNHFTFELIYETIYNREVEKEIKKIFEERIQEETINDKKQTEIIHFDDKFTIKEFDKEIKDIIDKIQNKELDKVKEENSYLKRKINQMDTQFGNKRFIAKNILTNEEIEFKSYAKAYDIAGLSAHSVRDNYIGKPRQARGFIFYEKGENHWEVPENFKFDPTEKPSTHNVMCKSIHHETKEVTYYNSIKEAAQIIGLFDDNDTQTQKSTKTRILGWNIDNGKSGNPIISKYRWYRLESCGFMVKPNGTREYIEKVTNEDNKLMDKSKIKELFKFTNDENDKLRNVDIDAILKKYNASVTCKILRKDLEKWGAVHCGKKITVPGSRRQGIGYCRIAFSNKEDLKLIK